MQTEDERKARRSFIKNSVKAGAGFTALSSAGFGSVSKILGASDRVRIGVIGAGGRAMQLINHLTPESQEPFVGIPQFATKHVSGAQVVAVADVYEPHRDGTAAKAGPGTAKFHDYRKLLDQKDVDAVIIASPDHWHKQMLIDAVEAGKDVYLEKPVTHSLAGGPEMIRAVEKGGRIVQTGTQHRSWNHYIRGKEIVDSIALGDVRLVESYWFLNYRRALEKIRQRKTDLSKLDWKAWLGSAPAQPFSEMKFRLWRYYWDFGGGALTDLMTHAIDTIQWYMNSPAPSSATAAGHNYDFEWECPDTVSCTLEYPKGFLVTYTGNHATGMDFGSIIFRGSKATLEISRAALALYEEDGNLFLSRYNSASQRWRPEPRVYVESTYEGTADNLRIWLESIRSRKTPNANIRAGVEAARAAHIGNAALLSGKRAKWDEQQQKIIV